MRSPRTAIGFLAAYIFGAACFAFAVADRSYRSPDALYFVAVVAEFMLGAVVGAIALAACRLRRVRRQRLFIMFLVVLLLSFPAFGFFASIEAAHEFFEAFGIPMLLLWNAVLAVVFLMSSKRAAEKAPVEAAV